MALIIRMITVVCLLAGMSDSGLFIYLPYTSFPRPKSSILTEVGWSLLSVCGVLGCCFV